MAFNATKLQGKLSALRGFTSLLVTNDQLTKFTYLHAENGKGRAFSKQFYCKKCCVDVSDEPLSKSLCPKHIILNCNSVHRASLLAVFSASNGNLKDYG